jgi:prepilin-type N-terminal cleavage/methylation domain-containing protein
MRRNLHGFTLLEVMVALMILAMSMVAISAVQTTSITNNAYVYRNTTASFLMHYVMTDLDIYYEREGFPTNSITDRSCDLPKDFEDQFECRYDLVRMEIEPDAISALASASMGNVLGENAENLNQMADTLKNAGQEGANPMDGQLAQIFMFASAFFGPEGQALMQMCPVNWDAILTALMGTQMFLPQIVQFASDRVRQLKVTITWKEGFRGTREFAVETFISSLPEEMKKAAEQADQLQNLRDLATPPTP